MNAIRRPVAIVLCIVFATLAGCLSDDDDRSSSNAICAEQISGKTAEGEPVTICQKLFTEAPFVRLPADQTTAATMQTINGVIELDIGGGGGDYTIVGVRMIDRNLNIYDLVDSNGATLNVDSPIMKANFFPSNRVHYLLYEAQIAASTRGYRLMGLRAIVMIEGRAIDERLLGAWEGVMSLYTGDGGANHSWSRDQNASVRIEMVGLTPYENFSQVFHLVSPILPDGTRFKALGGVVNATDNVKLSTGECARPLMSYGNSNPLFIAEDSRFTFWRYPAMHTAFSADFHIVNDYPKKLYPTYLGMAEIHNFRLQYYISPQTAPMDMKFILHGVPFGEMTFTIKQVKGGGESC